MHSNSTKGRSKLRHKSLAVVLTAVIGMLIASPFVLIGDSAEAVEYDFSATLKKTAIKVGLTETGYSPSLASIIGGIIYAGLGLVGVVFLIMVIIAGYRWMMAGGNEESITKARQQIKNGIIGVVVVLGAYAITYYIIFTFV